MNKVQLTLTKIWLRLLGDHFQRVDSIKLSDGQEVEAVIFNGRNTIKLGQCTPFNTILVNEILLQTPRLLNRVIMHELGHKRQWYGFLLYPIFLPILILGILMLPWSLALLIRSLFSDSMNVISALQIFFFNILCIIIPFSFSWFVEYKAESFTFKRLGVDEVLAADQEKAFLKRMPFYWLIIKLLTHPPTSLSIKIFRFFNRPQ